MALCFEGHCVSAPGGASLSAGPRVLPSWSWGILQGELLEPVVPDSAVPAAKRRLSPEEPPCQPQKRFHCLKSRPSVTTNRTHLRHPHESFLITRWSNLLRNKNQNLRSLTLISPRVWGLRPPLCQAVLTEVKSRQVASAHLLNVHLVLGTVKKVL